MAAIIGIRVMVVLALAACSAFCQVPEKNNDSLPDAPSAQTLREAQEFRAFLDTGRAETDTLRLAERDSALRFDSGHFEGADRMQKREDGFSLKTSSLKHNVPARSGGSFVARVGYAASGLVVTRDDSGELKLNKSYIMAVLASSLAHSAYRPYWRRSATQPFSDFGSTLGSDAGMNVFHQFEPGILQLMKNHGPKLVEKMAGELNRK